MRYYGVLSLFFVFLFVGCAAKKEAAQPVVVPTPKDSKRLELYNKLDNLKEGVWHVDEWKAFAKKICDDSKQQDCSVMGEIYHDHFYGYGKKQDRQNAIKVLQKGCQLNDSRSCLKLGTFADHADYPVGKSSEFFTKAEQIAQKGCEANYAMDCSVLSLLYFEGYGEIERDRARAKEYAHKACSMGHGGSCIFLGINADTHEEMREAHQKACALGIQTFCK